VEGQVDHDTVSCRLLIALLGVFRSPLWRALMDDQYLPSRPACGYRTEARPAANQPDAEAWPSAEHSSPDHRARRRRDFRDEAGYLSRGA